MNEIINRFVEYAQDQGSREPYRYKRAFHRMIFLSLGLDRFKNVINLNLGENLTENQWAYVVTAQRICGLSIESGMSQKLPYKGKDGVYELAKQEVTDFAKTVAERRPQKEKKKEYKPKAEIIKFKLRM